MIVVKRIVGESYDLETGKAVPKGLVLSNGSQEVTIRASDGEIEAVLRLMANQLADPDQEPDSPDHAPMSLVPPQDDSVSLNDGLSEWDDQESGLSSI